jgi:hypothetical protein
LNFVIANLPQEDLDFQRNLSCPDTHHPLFRELRSTRNHGRGYKAGRTAEQPLEASDGNKEHCKRSWCPGVLLWSTVVLLGGFVSVLRIKDFWILTGLSFLMACR